MEYFSKDQSAKAGVNYEECKGEVIFENKETEKFICVNLLETASSD